MSKENITKIKINSPSKEEALTNIDQAIKMLMEIRKEIEAHQNEKGNAFSFFAMAGTADISDSDYISVHSGVTAFAGNTSFTLYLLTNTLLESFSPSQRSRFVQMLLLAEQLDGEDDK